MLFAGDTVLLITLSGLYDSIDVFMDVREDEIAVNGYRIWIWIG